MTSTAVTRTVPLEGGYWYVESDNGIVPVDINYNASIEGAIQRGDQTVTIRSIFQTYNIDLTNYYHQRATSLLAPIGLLQPPCEAIQTNPTTGKQRTIRRYLTTQHEWAFQRNDMTFQVFHNSEYLEYEYMKDPTAQLTMFSPRRGYLLLVDFRQQTQMNIQTGKIRSIRRVQRSSARNNNNNDVAVLGGTTTATVGGFGGVATAVAPQAGFGGGIAVNNQLQHLFSQPTTDMSSIWKIVDGNDKKTNPTTTTDKRQREEEALGECAICLCDMVPSNEEVIELQGCKNHIFHQQCVRPLVQQSSSGLSLKCPICKQVSGTPETGNQPTNGTMTVSIQSSGSVQGIEGEVIAITYNFPNGIQDHNHPSPGLQFHGTKRVAYLPNISEGQEVLRLLQVAWDRRLIFTVGTSVTTGQSNCVVWAGIHHKTSISGGAYGYPDETYIARVKGELADRGVN